MPEEQPKKMQVTLTFDLVDDAGIDLPSFKMQVDGKAVGYLHQLELSVSVGHEWGLLRYIQFSNPRETHNEEDAGAWDIHVYGGKETDD